MELRARDSSGENRYAGRRLLLVTEQRERERVTACLTGCMEDVVVVVVVEEEQVSLILAAARVSHRVSPRRCVGFCVCVEYEILSCCSFFFYHDCSSRSLAFM